MYFYQHRLSAVQVSGDSHDLPEHRRAFIVMVQFDWRTLCNGTPHEKVYFIVSDGH
jgi:hypothetical protein